MNKKELYKVASYYKKRYKINIYDIYITKSLCQTYFNYNDRGGYIQVSFEQVKNFDKKRMTRRAKKSLSDKELVLFALLHELKHAIDFTRDRDKLEKEKASIITSKYLNDKKYHDTRAFELRADAFARQELKKWSL